MSYGSQPYVYGEIPAEASNTGTTRFSRIEDVKNWFIEGGWSIEEVGFRLKVVTTLPLLVPTHIFCQLQVFTPSADVLFALNLNDALETHFIIDSDDSCFDAETDRDQIGVSLANTSYSMTEIDVDPVSDSGWKAILGLETYSNTEKTHEIIWKYIGKLLSDKVGGPNIFKYPTTNVGSTYTTVFSIIHTAHISWNFDIGSFLSTTVSNLDGFGFIATSEDNVVVGNHLAVYVYSEQEDPGFEGVSNQIRFRSRLTEDFPALTTQHPLTTCEEEETITINELGGLTIVHDLVGFIGPTFFFIDTPELEDTNDEVHAWGGAFKIKALDGESDPNIRKALLLDVSSRFDGNNVETLRTVLTLNTDHSILLLEDIDTGDHLNFDEVVVSMCTYWSSKNDKTGIEWKGNVAEVFEPWFGWNIDGGGTVPLFCTIPDAIVVYRAIALGAPSTISEAFTWDGKVFRYYQTDRPGEDKGSSLALRVADSRIFTGSGYSGVPFYIIDTLSISPTEVPGGGTVTLTINVDDSQDKTAGGQCLVRVNNERLQLQGTPDHLVIFAADATSATVVLTDNDLGIEDIVQIQVIGFNDVKTTLNVLALAV